ncbi:MAG: hypothetical protein RhofKO_11970 [Rhodothermales bacterium]
MVIVGIAVVAGIQTFTEGKAKAETDAAVADAMRVISDLQAWYLKPVAFGGGGETAANWANVKFNSIGLDPTNDVGSENSYYETLNGCYQLTAASGKVTVAIKRRVANPTGEGATSCSGAKYADAEITSASPTTGVKWTYQ